MAFLTTNPSPFILNQPELTNVITSASGINNSLSNAVADLLAVVNTSNAAFSVNQIGSFNSPVITITNSLNLSNSVIRINGTTTLTSNSLNGNPYMAIQALGIEKLRATTTGIGVNLTVPTADLDIQGTTIQRGNIYVSSQTALGPAGKLYFNGVETLTSNILNGDPYLSFTVSGSEKARITGTGDIGIGNTAPTAKLDVSGNTTIRGNVVLSNAGTLFCEGNQILTSNSFNGANYLALKTSGVEKARITAAGDVGIGNTAPLTKLDLTGSELIRGSLYVSSMGAAVTSSLGYIYADGDVFARHVLYPSDPALKDNIRPYVPSGELPIPVEFTWKQGGQRDIGVLASDIQRIEPLCVQQNQSGSLVVDYPKLVVLCLAELHSMRSTITGLTNTIYLKMA